MSSTKEKLKINKFFQKMKLRLEYLLFPDDIRCVFCGCDITHFYEKPFCKDCEKTLPFNNKHRCMICDQPIGNEANICDICQTHKRNFKRAYCPFIYEGAVKSSILSFKESNQRFRAKAFARMIVEYMRTDIPALDVITFIPMTKKKEKSRTFNQSKLLAEEIGKLLNLPVLSMFSKVKDSTQKSSTYKTRLANVVGMYVLKKVKLNRNQNVLIVDDILTTCATVGYCAGLIYPKVNNVYVCGIAREYVRPKIMPKNHTKNLKMNFFQKK